MDDSFPVFRNMYGPGAILGVEQFIYNDKWNMDIISKVNGCIMAKIDVESFEELKNSQP